MNDREKNILNLLNEFKHEHIHPSKFEFEEVSIDEIGTKVRYKDGGKSTTGNFSGKIEGNDIEVAKTILKQFRAS